MLSERLTPNLELRLGQERVVVESVFPTGPAASFTSCSSTRDRQADAPGADAVAPWRALVRKSGECHRPIHARRGHDFNSTGEPAIYVYGPRTASAPGCSEAHREYRRISPSNCSLMNRWKSPAPYTPFPQRNDVLRRESSVFVIWPTLIAVRLSS
jgi:hypothetical protein